MELVLAEVLVKWWLVMELLVDMWELEWGLLWVSVLLVVWWVAQLAVVLLVGWLEWAMVLVLAGALLVTWLVARWESEWGSGSVLVWSGNGWGSQWARLLWGTCSVATWWAPLSV
jgi:hypothetical protein